MMFCGCTLKLTDQMTIASNGLVSDRDQPNCCCVCSGPVSDVSDDVRRYAKLNAFGQVALQL